MRKFLLLLLYVFPSFVFAQNYNSKKLKGLFEKPVERKYYVKERYYKGNLYVEGLAVQKIYSKKNRIELKRGPWKWYYRNSQLKDSIFYSDLGLPEGIEIRYRRNGTIAAQLDYGTSTNFKVKQRNWLVATPKDYSITYYYESPNVPRRIEMYKNAKKNGSWRTFDESGKIIKEKIYENGRLISSQKF